MPVDGMPAIPIAVMSMPGMLCMSVLVLPVFALLSLSGVFSGLAPLISIPDMLGSDCAKAGDADKSAAMQTINPKRMSVTHIHRFVVLVMGAGCGDERAIALRRHRGQLLQQRHHVPDFFVAMRAAPGGHARHLDAMLDDPELLRRIAARKTGENRRLGIHAGAHFILAHAGHQMAAGAHGGIMLDAFGQHLG